jgi:hypothetical protein
MMSNKLLASLVACLTLAATQAAVAGQDEFCEGYYRGYLEGYKRESGSIFDPSVPFCPTMPRMRAGAPRDDTEHGYEVGYEQGRDAARRRF